MSRKKVIALTIFALFAIIIHSCTSKIGSVNTHSLDEFLNGLTDSDSVFIIPGTGCNSCIEKALIFASNQINNSRYYFVVTRIQDAKIVKNMLGTQDTEAANIYFDKQNKLGDYGYYEIYPFLYTKGEIHYLMSTDFDKL